MPTTSNGSRERNSSSAFLLKIIPFRIADCARVWSARRNKFRSGSRNSKPLALTWSCFNSALNSKKWSASRTASFAGALPWLRRLRPTPSCESVVLRRILRLLWDVRAAFEIDPVAVGVSERHNPHPISDKWVSADFNSLSCRVTIDRQRVFAHEIDGCAFSHFAAWVPGIVPFFPKLLQHQGRLADLQPAPAEFALVDPFLGHLEAQTVDVITQRFLHVRHTKKWHGLLDVCGGFLLKAHFMWSFEGPSVHGYLRPNETRLADSQLRSRPNPKEAVTAPLNALGKL